MDIPVEETAEASDAPIITLFSRSVLGSLSKKQVPTLFQWSKGALVDLFLESVLHREVLVCEEDAITILEESRMYLQENLCPEILKRLLKGVNIYADDDDDDEIVFSKFLVFLPFGNLHVSELDMTFWKAPVLNPFDLTVVKKLLQNCANITTLIMPKFATDELLVQVEATCRSLRSLELKSSIVTDMGVTALAGFETHEEEPIFRRVRPGLQELRYLGLMGVSANREATFDEQTVGVSVEALAFVLESLPKLQVLSYPRQSETILMCKKRNIAHSLPLDHYTGPFCSEKGELLTGYLPNLSRIDVNLNLVNDEALPYFRQMKNLKDLRFGVMSFSSSSLEHLTTLGNQLQTFFITCLNLKSSDLLFLRAILPGVQQLSVAYSKFVEDVPFGPGPGWEKLVELEIRSESAFVWSIPKFCTENSKKVTTLFFRSPMDKTSKEEDLGKFLRDDKFRNLECLFLRIPSLPVTALVCVAMALCPNLKKVGNMDMWGIKGSFMILLEDHLEKNNIDLEMLTHRHEGMFYNLSSVRRVF